MQTFLYFMAKKLPVHSFVEELSFNDNFIGRHNVDRMFIYHLHPTFLLAAKYSTDELLKFVMGPVVVYIHILALKFCILESQ